MDSSSSCDLLRLTFDEILGTTATTTTALFDFTDPLSPVQLCCLTCLLFSVLVFVVSELSGNYSQTDKIWSITPFVYTWILICDSRTFLMFILSAIWGLRLSWNFFRRGGYTWPPWNGDEDYRWMYLMGKVPLRDEDYRFKYLLSVLKNKWVWMMFNLFFISIYQNVLLLLVVSPAVVANIVASKCGDSSFYSSSLNMLDLLGSILFLSFVLIESIADNQQQRFQNEKHRRIASGETLDGEFLDGFTRSGLFSIIRKPNYASEQGLWISFGIFSLASFQSGIARQQHIYNWSHLGWCMYVMLFCGSGPFTEYISLSKYPRYAEYMTETPLFVPNIFKLLFRKETSNKKKKQEKISL